MCFAIQQMLLRVILLTIQVRRVIKKKLNETLEVVAKEQQFKQVYFVKKLSTIAFCMDNFQS